LIGVAFLLPFLWFLWRGAVEPALRGWLWAIFSLGCAAGRGGLVDGGLRLGRARQRVALSAAFHLTLACAIFALIVWTIQRLRPQPLANAPMRLRATAIILLALVSGQIYWGAAGRGPARGPFSTTLGPPIDGHVLAGGGEPVLQRAVGWRNLVREPLTVQFTHRMIAYALWVAGARARIDAARAGRRRALDHACDRGDDPGCARDRGRCSTRYRSRSRSLTRGLAVVVLAIAVLHSERLMPRRGVQRVEQPIIGAA